MGQEKHVYKFNYYTIYEYKKDSLDINPLYELTYSNKTDNSYHLMMTFDKNKVLSAIIIDFSNRKRYTYNISDFDVENVKNDIASIFKKATSVSVDLTLCREKKKISNVYTLEYVGDSLVIKRFKNLKQKKIINECHMQVGESELCENNFWNLQFLMIPLACNKFSIDRINGIVLNSFYIVDEKKSFLRKLVEINNSDLSITINQE